MELQREPTNSQFDLVRYPMLIQLWSHHNQMQLQWPALIVGTALIFLTYIIEGRAAKILDYLAWGNDRELIFGVGLPMALTGIGLLMMLHLMNRACLIMKIIEDQLGQIERGKADLTFSEINHPPGRSGSKFIRYFMLICLALPMVAFGILFSVGPVLSVLPFFGGLLLVGGVKIARRKSSRFSGSSARSGLPPNPLLGTLTPRATSIWTVQGISLFRLLAAVLFTGLAFSDVSPILLSALYGLAMSSDLIDGYLSRKLDAQTSFGKVLDLVADRVLTGVSLLYAAARGIDLLPLAFIAARDIIMLGMRSIRIGETTLLPTNRVLGGAIATLLWGNTLILILAGSDRELIRMINLSYWVCAIIVLLNFAWRLYVSAARIKMVSTER